MASRNLYLAGRLREVLLNGKWIANTNYQEQLMGVDWKQAIQKVGNLNTIAALTFHINYYLDGLLNVFNGGNLEIRDKYSYDLPEIKSETDWSNLVNAFLRNAEIFAAKVEAMPDELFDQPFVDEKYGSYIRNIEGVIEHSYYHLGQIALIKKLHAASGQA
ncbi:MAG: DinB family protein [Saprospiraceae bacterium]|nr:DinB family protein [Saprospiraceae bacterium]